MFDNWVELYDGLVDWPKRLAREEVFYRKLFAEAGVQKVLDAACGSGRHAALFHNWGLTVEGADLSPEMIAQARKLFGEPQGLHWAVRGFDQQVTPSAAFDAALCVGNSLALASDREMIACAVRELTAAVRPGGAIIIHVLNAAQLPDGPCIWQKCRDMELNGRRVLVLKGVHRCGERGYVDLAVVDPASETMIHSESVPFIGLDVPALSEMFRSAGAAEVDFFGGYQGEPFAAGSVDLIAVARR